MMKAKDLKNFLETVDDEAEIFIPASDRVGLSPLSQVALIDVIARPQTTTWGGRWEPMDILVSQIKIYENQMSEFKLAEERALVRDEMESLRRQLNNAESRRGVVVLSEDDGSVAN